MRIAGTVEDSIVDGEGIRFVVFTQGCIRLCADCHNPHTQDSNGGYDVTIDELFERVIRNPLCDGLTLSGGEPVKQAAECADLARRVTAIGKNVWCYSGYELHELQSYAALAEAKPTKKRGRKNFSDKHDPGHIPGQLFADYLGDYVAPTEVADLLANIDVLIDGMYIEGLKSLQLKWRGSSNQRVWEQYEPDKWREINVDGRGEE